MLFDVETRRMAQKQRAAESAGARREQRRRQKGREGADIEERRPDMLQTLDSLQLISHVTRLTIPATTAKPTKKGTLRLYSKESMFVTKEILKEIQNKPDGGTHPAALARVFIRVSRHLSHRPPCFMQSNLPFAAHSAMGTRRGTSMLASPWEGDASILPIIATARDMGPACRPVRPTQADRGV